MFRRVAALFRCGVRAVLRYSFRGLVRLYEGLARVRRRATFTLLGLRQLLTNGIRDLLRLLISRERRRTLVLRIRSVGRRAISLLNYGAPVIEDRSTAANAVSNFTMDLRPLARLYRTLRYCYEGLAV